MSATSTTTRAPRALRFRLTLDPCPQAMLRVLGLFAQRSHVPDLVELTRRPRSTALRIELPLGGAEGELILHKLRAIPSVRSAAMHPARR